MTALFCFKEIFLEVCFLLLVNFEIKFHGIFMTYLSLYNPDRTAFRLYIFDQVGYIDLIDMKKSLSLVLDKRTFCSIYCFYFFLTMHTLRQNDIRIKNTPFEKIFKYFIRIIYRSDQNSFSSIFSNFLIPFSLNDLLWTLHVISRNLANNTVHSHISRAPRSHSNKFVFRLYNDWIFSNSWNDRNISSLFHSFLLVF